MLIAARKNRFERSFHANTRGKSNLKLNKTGDNNVKKTTGGILAVITALPFAPLTQASAQETNEAGLRAPFTGPFADDGEQMDPEALAAAGANIR